jgi:hypothetical protein
MPVTVARRTRHFHGHRPGIMGTHQSASVVVSRLGCLFDRFLPILLLSRLIMSQGFCSVYTPTPEPVNLSELRAKTDQQLHDLVHSTLNLGLNFVRMVENPCSAGHLDHSEQLLRRAGQAVVEVKQLLPVLSEEQRRGFGPMLNELTEALDRLDRKRRDLQIRHSLDVVLISSQSLPPSTAPSHQFVKRS